jgi:hypothetical protein
MDNIQQKIKEINEFFATKPWFDFELIELVNKNAKIAGSTDFSLFREIEIVIEDISYVQCPDNWKSDTKKEVIVIPTMENQKKMNMSYQVEQGYTLIQFVAEDMEPIYFSCKGITYNFDKIYYKLSI